MKMLKFVIIGAMGLIGSVAQAAVPPDLAAKLRVIGPVVAPAATAPLYAPLQLKPPGGIKVTRDIAYAADARNLLDVFAPEKKQATQPVLIFVPGGRGDRIEQVPEGASFYDNVMWWAAKNRMIGVNVGRRAGGPGMTRDAGGVDVAEAIKWVHANIGQYGGDPGRVFIWGHSAGAISLSVYLARPQLYGPYGVGVKGAILEGGPYNLAPAYAPPAFGGAPGGPGAAPPPGGAGGSPPAGAVPPLPMDPRTQLENSVLPGLIALQLPLFVGAAELDLPPAVQAAEVLKEELCKAGKCPTYLLAKDHSHMSMLFSVNTADESNSKPILDWIRKIK